MKEAEHHALERALREVVGGDRPADHTFEIVAAVRAARAGAASRRAAPRRRGLWLGLASGAAAAALAMAGWWGAPPAAPELELYVRDGSVTWGQAGAIWTGRAGQSHTRAPRIGDRIGADPRRGSRLELRPFGTLAMTRGTRLEVLDMEWKEFGIGFGSGTLTVAVLAGSITWFGNDAATAAAAGDESRLAMRPPGEVAVAPLTAREQALQAEVEDLRARLAAASRTPVPAAEEPAATPAAPEAPAFAPLADVPELRDLFAKADWVGIANSSIALNALTREMMALIAAGEQVPREMIGELKRLGGIMQKYGALVTAEASVEGQHFETKVRGPVIGANWLTACLQGAGHPLDAAQRQSLATLSQRYDQEDRARRAAYTDDVPRLQRLIDEVELQDRFYRDTRALLDKDQAAFIYSERYRHRANASLIGEGAQSWAETVQSPQYATKADFVDSVSGAWSRSLTLQGDGRQVLRGLVQRWIDDYPAEYWDKPMDKLDRWGFYEVERVRRSAQLQLRFLGELRKALPLTPAQLKVIHDNLSIIVPYRKGP